MAERPIFVPDEDAPGLVREIPFSIVWHGGFAPVQKKKNMKSPCKRGGEGWFAELLEISTKVRRKARTAIERFQPYVS